VGLRLGLSLPFIGVILAANRAMRVVSSPVIGVFADRFGGRRTLLVGLAVQIVVLGLFAIGIVAHAAGPFFLAGRLLHGPGSACVFIAAQALALHAGGPSQGGHRSPAASAIDGAPTHAWRRSRWCFSWRGSRSSVSPMKRQDSQRASLSSARAAWGWGRRCSS